MRVSLVGYIKTMGNLILVYYKKVNWTLCVTFMEMHNLSCF